MFSFLLPTMRAGARPGSQTGCAHSAICPLQCPVLGTDYRGSAYVFYGRTCQYFRIVILAGALGVETLKSQALFGEKAKN